MQEYTDRIALAPAGVEEELKWDFEVRLRESSTLAFRVAFAVPRHSENAEDVAQEALARAYRNFRRLRDRDRFRAWLTRMTWRMAIDRQRADRRRVLREAGPQNSGTVETPNVVVSLSAAPPLTVESIPPFESLGRTEGVLE